MRNGERYWIEEIVRNVSSMISATIIASATTTQ